MLYKMNPPLRTEENRKKLLNCLVGGKIDWIETDHAPHTKSEKTKKSGPHSLGIPGFPVYSRLLAWLEQKGISNGELKKYTHENITAAFGIDIDNSQRKGEIDLESEYEFDPYRCLHK